ncbi:hypothetical protein [uncultured Agrobacterium sp.]|uniref:hypothetical protein n=1 Tax=uncultured Agrobacterium sp. TaxID=157277 RepID=UPI002582710E|nr:hypothetical protein [uncultured Agrobacterium sp.]
MKSTAAITPMEAYLREQIAGHVSELKTLHQCIAEKVGLSDDMSFVNYLLELVWLEATRPLASQLT